MSGERLARRIFRWALAAFPRRFRREHAGEMEAAFLDELRRRPGAARSAAYAARAVADAVRQGMRERIRRNPPPGHGARRRDDAGRMTMLKGIGGDVRLAVRVLAKNPAFTFAAVVVLALGIGANATVFSALKTAVLAPPPYPDVERLVLVNLVNEHRGRGETDIFPWSYPKLQVVLEAEDRLVDPVAGFAQRSVTLTGGGPASRVVAEVVTPGYFLILGREPSLGRAFTADEDDPSRPPRVVVLGHRLWQDRFGGDPEMVGRDVTLNGTRLQVVGVAPRGFQGLTGGADLWVPAAVTGELISRFMVASSGSHWMQAVGRLRSGARLEDADAQMQVLGAATEEVFPEDDPNVSYSGTARSLTQVRANPEARASLLLLVAAAGLVLLVACANLSGLLLARARSRVRDSAVRLAIGGSRWHLIRSSLTESLVLTGLGGAAGVLLALWGTRALAAAWPDRLLRSGGDGYVQAMDLDTLVVDPGVLAFALGVTLLTALLVGLAPALRSSRSDLAANLKEGAGATRRGRGRWGWDARAVLVGAQVALALVLLIGAGLVGRSMASLLDVEPGFDTENLLFFTVSIPRTSSHAENEPAFTDEFLARMEALPQVTDATLGCHPLRGHCWITRVQEKEGAEPIPEGEGELIGVHMVADGHFRKLGIPILRGRPLNETDGREGVMPAVVLSETAAEELYPGEEALGRRIRLGVGLGTDDNMAEVVGVAGDVLYGRPDDEIMPEAYYSLRQTNGGSANYMVRTSGEPLDAVPDVRRTLQELDPTLAMWGVTTAEDRFLEGTGSRRVLLSLLALFAVITVLLAATGTWGVVSYAVADRRRELGLRIALGAEGGRLLGTVLRSTVTTAVLGLTAGLGVAWATTRVLDTFLYGVAPRDPWTFAGGAALLLAVVLVASFVPARRATTVDPMEVLKSE